MNLQDKQITMKTRPLISRSRSIFIPLSLFILASCATNERVDFSIPKNINNEQVFACTLIAIEQHNLPHLRTDPNHPSKYSAFPPTFQENIVKRDPQKGTLLIGEMKTGMYDYPLKLSRKRENVTLRSSSYGIYYSHDQHLQPTLLKLSEKIQQCLPEAENINTPNKEASIY